MMIAHVIGTVVASKSAMSGPFRLLSPYGSDPLTSACSIALDPVGARHGDLVLVAQGSSCRWTSDTDEKPVDALIVGIIDLIHRHGKEVYRSDGSGV
ncbi:MAG: EutN/CcmL family microcompartment protein [Sphaerochaeta sp.]|jgi:microcompartment protein CcmK/EutM|nr:EutN/CcmL family microcompartment protein [Sphaerochaeta sp.]MDX9914518.1 EutN/CcmL family microcompartment protein [Sphaerochaeta sp.]